MLAWLCANIGTIIICIVLAAIVAYVITVMVKDKKKGKSSCGCSCVHCPMGCCCERSAGREIREKC